MSSTEQTVNTEAPAAPAPEAQPKESKLKTKGTGGFATGMNGDEDLGQDIQMKGEPYHY